MANVGLSLALSHTTRPLTHFDGSRHRSRGAKAIRHGRQDQCHVLQGGTSKKKRRLPRESIRRLSRSSIRGIPTFIDHFPADISLRLLTLNNPRLLLRIGSFSLPMMQ